MSEHFVIVGNGAAGFRAAKAIRRADSAAQISLFTQDRYPFYLRRQLGDFLSGNLTLSELIFQSRNAYRRERIDLFLMTRVDRLDPRQHEVRFSSGHRARYDRLLLATGTEAVPLDVPGASLEGVARFDSLSAAVATRQLAQTARRAVILDEGLIGLNLAESFAVRGLKTTYLLAGERFWPRMLDDTTASLVESLLEEGGVALHRAARVRNIVGAGSRAIGVEVADGRVVAADLVACGCRRRPAVQLLGGSGIEVGRGIRVDTALRTSQPDVFAAGDVAELVGPDDDASPEPPFCWQRAWTQGGEAAASMLDRPAAAAHEAVRLRTTVFGRDLAVIGRGNAPQAPAVDVVEMRAPPEIYRRLVFDHDQLDGAIVYGTGDWVPELAHLVAERADRHEVARALAMPDAEAEAENLPVTFAHHCPICAAELVIHRGSRVGSIVRCRVCSTDLVVGWDGERGYLQVSRP